MKNTITSTLLVLISFISIAQNIEKKEPRKEIGNFAVLVGLHQPILLKGGNFAFNYTTKKNISLEASFGIALNYKLFLSKDEVLKYNSVITPFSYGVGIGYFYKGFNLNFEPKGTMFAITDHSNKKVNYTTWSVGAGLYYNFFIYKNLFLQPSIRYWHKIGSTLPNDKVQMTNSNNETFNHIARKPGSNGWIYGLSLGWYFNKQKRTTTKYKNNKG